MFKMFKNKKFLLTLILAGIWILSIVMFSVEGVEWFRWLVGSTIWVGVPITLITLFYEDIKVSFVYDLDEEQEKERQELKMTKKQYLIHITNKTEPENKTEIKED